MPAIADFGSLAAGFDHVVGAEHQHHVGVGEVGVDVLHLEDLVVRHSASASSTFMCPGIRPATGWIA